MQQSPLVSANKKRSFTKALQVLRRRGYVAVQNAACCAYHAFSGDSDLPSSNHIVITTACSLFHVKRTAVMKVYFCGPAQEIRDVFESQGLRTRIITYSDDRIEVDLNAVSDWEMEQTGPWAVYQPQDLDLDPSGVRLLVSIDGIMRYTDQTTPIMYVRDGLLVCGLYRDGDEYVETQFLIKSINVFVQAMDWFAVRGVRISNLNDDLARRLKEA